MLTAYDMVRRAASWYPSAPALVDLETDEKCTYNELIELVEKKSSKLSSMGISPGSVITICADKSIDTIVTILALNRSGYVTAVLSPRLKWPEICRLVDRSESAAFILDATISYAGELRSAPLSCPTYTIRGQMPGVANIDELDEEWKKPVSRGYEDPEFIFYTSGTTSLPKAVVIPVRATEARIMFMSTQAGHTTGRHNQVAGVMPIFHVIGFYAVLLMSLTYGGTYYVVRQYDPRIIHNYVKAHAINSLFVTPTHASMLLEQNISPEAMASVEHFTIAGASLEPRLMKDLRGLFSGRITNIYGTTEAMNSLYGSNIEEPSLMFPSLFNEVRIMKQGAGGQRLADFGEEGELQISLANPAMFLKYQADEDVTRAKQQDGWYRTGDAAIAHATGQIQVLGRFDDTIISGGENIHPNEVEAILTGIPEVKEAAVVGVADRKWGQIVAAAITFHTTKKTAMELDQIVRDSTLADFKRPRRYYAIGEIPKNPAGKVDRASLRDSLVDQDPL